MGLFSKDIKNMNDLFVHTLRDIYYAEKQVVKALPEMASKSNDPQLKQGFQTHLRETENHVKRLEQSSTSSAKKPRAWTTRRSTASSRRPTTWPARWRISRFLMPPSSPRAGGRAL